MKKHRPRNNDHSNYTKRDVVNIANRLDTTRLLKRSLTLNILGQDDRFYRPDASQKRLNYVRSMLMFNNNPVRPQRTTNLPHRLPLILPEQERLRFEVCRRRQSRKEVIHALRHIIHGRRKGRGGKKQRQKSWKSNVKC